MITKLLASLLPLTMVLTGSAQNSFPSSGVTLLNSGTDQAAVLKDGRSGTNWNYLEWQFSNGSRDWVLGRRSSTGYFTLFREGLGELLTIDNSGNLGIGTIAPSSKLAVVGNGNIANFTNAVDQDFVINLSTGGATTKRTIIGPNGNRFSLGVGGNENVSIADNGYVGIGTTSPAQLLHVTGNVRIQGANSTIPHAYLEFNRYDGTRFASIGQGIPGLLNSTFDIQHYNGNDIRFLNTGSEQLRITASGNVGIGTSTPDQKLTVNGTVHATRVKVETTVPGPDYVFEKDYALPSLEQIKSYIDENKHLPDVPSAKEMEAKGIDVGDMNMVLLKKIEEMTLYMIEQEKRIKMLEEKIK
jgi:hypothetical protein